MLKLSIAQLCRNIVEFNSNCMKTQVILTQAFVAVSLLFTTGCIGPAKDKKEADAKAFEERGLNIVNSTKSHLVTNLMKAIATYGTAGAVEFCNVHAMTLTDSIASLQDARIRRVTDRPRNKANQANEAELTYINLLKSKTERHEALTPSIQLVDGKMTGYYPIQTAKMCIQCHGTVGTDILPETSEKLLLLYPEDKATGYVENQLRGLFVVEMN